MNPSQRSNRCEQLYEMRALPRALMGGTKAMRAAGETFCPRHKAEDAETYAARIAATILYGGFSDTVHKQAAKLFGKPIVLDDDVPEDVATLCDDIDGQGRALTPFMMDVMLNAMCDGIAYVLVDFPDLMTEVEEMGDDEEPVATTPTLADQQAIGARPYWVMVKADDLRGWKTEMVGGQQVLVEARIRECVCVENPSDPFKDEMRERMRILHRGSWELWEEQMDEIENKKVWVQIAEGTSALDEITLVPFYTNRSGFMEGEPPLMRLAELNQDHWISSSEQRHALTFLRFAMLAVTGVNKDDLKGLAVGPDALIPLPDGSDAKFLEHNGKGIEAGFADLDRIEKRMESAGMTVRIENAGAVTATTSAINSNELNAALGAVAQGMKDGVEQALAWTAQMNGGEDGGTVEVYDDFIRPQPGGTVDDLTKLRASRDISRTTLWDELKRRHVLSEDFDAEAERAALLKDKATDMGSAPLPPTSFSRAGGAPQQQPMAGGTISPFPPKAAAAG